MMPPILRLGVRVGALCTLLTSSAGCRPESSALPPLPPKVDALTKPQPGEVRPLREAIVTWTAGVRGEVEACGCPTVPYGGLDRRARLLTALRRLDVPVFTLDAGDMLVKGTMARGDAERRERATVMLDLMRGLSLDAWAPSSADRVPGGPDLLQGTGAISATWPGFSGAVVLERGGFRLGVAGVAGGGEGDAVAAVSRAIKAAEGVQPADLWVLLANADRATQLRLARGLPGLGAILGEHDLEGGPVPVLGVPDRGRYVGILHVALGSAPGPLRVEEEGPLTHLAAQRLRVALSSDADWEGQQRLPSLRERVAGEGSGFNLAYVERRPLGSDLDGASVLDDRLARLRVDSTRAAQSRADTRPSGYVSGAACVRCHSDFFAAWSYSPHAQAFGSLIERKATTNPECLPCHTTGYGQPGGFGEPTTDNLSRFKAVQCEGCHGPLAGHPDTMGGGAAHRAPVEATCLECHDEANSPQFDYPRYLRGVSCVQVRLAREESTVPPTLK